MELSINKKILNNLNEISYGSNNIEDIDKPLLDGYELFDKYCEYEGEIEDFADRWNSCTGDPDTVRRNRIKIINPTVINFVSDYGEDLINNWDEFYDIMEDNNQHTALFAIEKEIEKYK